MAGPPEWTHAAGGWLARLAERLGLRWRAGAPYEATRRRLLLLNLGVVSAILLVMAVAVYAAESQALQEQVDQALISRSQLDRDVDAQAIVLSETGQGFILPGPDQGPGQQDGPYQPMSPNIFTLVIASDGTLVLDPDDVSQVGLPDLASARAAMTGDHPHPVTVTYGGQAYRVLSVPLGYHGQLVGALQIGESLAFMQQQLSDLALRLLLVGAGMLALTAAASLYLSDRALRPMREAYERQRQFAAAASHELRTPLAFVRSQLELVTRRMQRAGAGGQTSGAPAGGAPAADGALLATSEEDLRDTLNEVDYMTRLVRDLLLMARDQSDHRSIAWEPVDIAELAREAAATIQPAAAARGLRLETRGGGEPLWVDGDRDRLRQLLLILLENATHYTPAGGTIWIETSQARGSLLARRRPLAQVVVGDTGVGIPLESQERIFEAFYRAEGHTSRQASEPTGAQAQVANRGGAGLGLALARWIVTAHEGELALRSAPGEGSVFTVSLPERAGSLVSGDDAPRESEKSETRAAAPIAADSASRPATRA